MLTVSVPPFIVKLFAEILRGIKDCMLLLQTRIEFSFASPIELMVSAPSTEMQPAGTSASTVMVDSFFRFTVRSVFEAMP